MQRKLREVEGVSVKESDALFGIADEEPVLADHLDEPNGCRETVPSVDRALDM